LVYWNFLPFNVYLIFWRSLFRHGRSFEQCSLVFKLPQQCTIDVYSYQQALIREFYFKFIDGFFYVIYIFFNWRRAGISTAFKWRISPGFLVTTTDRIMIFETISSEVLFLLKVGQISNHPHVLWLQEVGLCMAWKITLHNVLIDICKSDDNPLLMLLNHNRTMVLFKTKMERILQFRTDKISFGTFPHNHQVNTNELATNGFSYNDRHKSMQCFYCTQTLFIPNRISGINHYSKQLYPLFRCRYMFNS
jgi:hypothetical protein